ncbi:MAG: hypothetical protein ACK5OB_15020 [Pirellula sp.]
MDNLNPYQPPAANPDAIATETRRDRVVAGPLMLSIEWTAVLCFNLIVPVLFGMGMTSEQAKIGVFLAVAMIACIGYYFCYARPLPVLFIIRGGVLVALSQFFPILQVFAGALSIQILLTLGIIEDSDILNMLSTATAGFLAALLTGTILMIAAFVVGILLRLVTPDRWWLAKERY